MGDSIQESGFIEVLALIRKARTETFRSVNKQLIELYWQVGEYISKKVESAEWGRGVVENLAIYLKRADPDLRGFSDKNLWRMKNFFETYRDSEKLSPLVRELSWTNNIIILSRANSMEEREFYLRLCRKENYSKRELERQIDSGLYERFLLSGSNLSTPLREIHPDSPAIFRDTYVLDFLDLPEPHVEKDLKKAIVKNLKNFIMELGKDFTFVGEEYRLQVGNSDFFIDLLFFHRELCCLVAFELKIDSFKPEYMGKMDFYLEALDRQVRKPHEKPSVGIILCKGKDQEVVEYTLSRSLSPAMVAEYRTKLIGKDVLERKLHDFYMMSLDDGVFEDRE